MKIIGEEMQIFITDLKPEVQEYVLQAYGFRHSDRNLDDLLREPIKIIPVNASLALDPRDQPIK